MSDVPILSAFPVQTNVCIPAAGSRCNWNGEILFSALMFRAIDCRLRLAGDMNHSERSYLRLTHLHRNRIAFERDHKIGISLWISKRTLPQTLRIRGLFPDSMIAFVDHTPKWDASILQRAHMVTQIHEQSGILGQSLQVSGEFVFERETSARVHPRFAKAARVTQNGAVTSEYDRQDRDCAKKLNISIACQLDQKERSKRHRYRKGRKQLQAIANVVM